jgi:carboxylesterase
MSPTDSAPAADLASPPEDDAARTEALSDIMALAAADGPPDPTDAASRFSFSLPGENGKGVLLIHGLTGAPDEMRYLARQFNRDGYTVYAPMLAGHGVDGKLLLTTGWRDWLASIVAAYDDFSKTVDEVYVAGICLGGLLGVALAEKRPAIKGLAVYSVTFNHDGWSMPKVYRSGRMLKHVGSLPFVRRLGVPEAPPFGIKNERLRDWVANSPDMGVAGALDSFPLGALAQQYGLADHVVRIGRKVTTPTLIIHAEEDDQAHPRNAKRLRAVLGGPVRIEWLHNSYHMVHVDQQRSEVARLTRLFFENPRAEPGEV